MNQETTVRHLARLKRRIYELRAQVAYAERVKDVMNRIHAARDLDQIFVELLEDIRSLCDGEHLTLYAVDFEKREVYSRFLDLDRLAEIRLPIDSPSIVGFIARTRQAVNITDAYDATELARVSPTLAFDSTWDARTGVRTRQVLAVPVLSGGGVLSGVIQLINKKGGDHFTREDEQKVLEIARTLGVAFHNQHQLARSRPTRFDLLVSARLLSQRDLESAVDEAHEKRMAVEDVLIARHKIRKEDIGRSLSSYYGCPFVDAAGIEPVAAALIEGINLEYLKAQCWVPLKDQGDCIQVLVDDPHCSQKNQDIRRLFQGRKVQLFVGLRQDILRLLESAGASCGAGGPGTRSEATTILDQLAAENHAKAAEAGNEARPERAAVDEEEESAVVRLVDQMIADACAAGASDIHVEPCGDAKPTVIRFRVDGNCHEYLKVPPEHRRALSSRLKILAGLDIADRRKPQDGKMKVRLREREIELRVATIPTAGPDNEDVVLRILSASEPIPLEKLRMHERNVRELKKLLAKPYGMILCVGPTGSGKTTTLHSALGHINTQDVKIWTAEDPVEITQDGLRQVQVRPKIGFDFAAALRAMLRADPDVIMIGEVRDRETAQIAIEASLTGHLVLSTLHTNSAVETVTRFLEMGMDPFNFADALLGVLAQRLARTICEGCKEAYRPSRAEYDSLALAYGQGSHGEGNGDGTLEKLGCHDGGDLVLHRGKGCDACRGTGYKGRIGLHELLVTTSEVKGLIHARSRVDQLLDAALRQGMTTLLQDGVLKILEGFTDHKQVQAVAM